MRYDRELTKMKCNHTGTQIKYQDQETAISDGTTETEANHDYPSNNNKERRYTTISICCNSFKRMANNYWIRSGWSGSNVLVEQLMTG